MAVNSQKLLPQGNKGGAMTLARPKVSLVKKEVKKDITSAPDTMLVIKTRVVEIEKILKGSVALDKKLQDQERKEKQKLLRAEEEKELETKDEDDADRKVKKKKSKIKLGFLDGLIKFINDILMGWLLVRMIDWLPQLKKIIPILGKALDFITNTVIGAVDILGTFLMWGDKAITGSRKFVQNIFGEGGAKVFDKLISTIGTLFNVITVLGMVAAAFGSEWGKDTKGPKGPKGPKPKWQKALQQKWKKSWLGKRVRNATAFRKRLTRSVSQALKPKNIIKNIRNIKPLERLKNFKPLEKLKNIKPLERLKNIKMPQIRTPEFLKNLNIGAKIKNAQAWIQSLPTKRKALFDAIGKNLTDFKTNQSAKWGARLKKLRNLKPQAAIDKLTARIRPHIDDILNKNPIIKKLVTNLKPANAKGSIRGLLTKAANNPLLKKLINTLKTNKAATKGMGPVDKIIAALTALWAYNQGGESPINAIVQGLGGLLGWTAGFSAATAVPVLGQSGVFNFMGGMAGAWAGDQIGKVILRGLSKTGLADIEDPIMGGKDIEEGRPARKLVRDPDVPIGDTQNQDPTVGGEGEEKTTITISRSNQPNLNTLLRSDKRADIEQALYTMRIDAAKGSGKGISDWVGNKKHAKDADLIMEHGLHNVIIDGGKVTLKESYKASLMPIDVNSVAKNTEAISKSASYEEGSEGGTVVIVENSSGGGDQQTESGSTVVAGGGSDSSAMDDFAYKGDV